MPFPLAALAIMGGAKLAGGLLKKKGQVSAAKEQKRAEDANLQAQYESNLAGEDNREDDRLMRTQGIAQQLSGLRALSPEVIKAALTRRRTTARKGVAQDTSKGLGWGALGGVADTVGDFAGAYTKGVGMQEAAGAGPSTGILAKAAQVAPQAAPMYEDEDYKNRFGG